MSDPVRSLGDADLYAPTSGSSAPAAATTEPPGSPFSPARQRGSARQRILDVARELFCSRGYDRTPLRAVSDSLGVTKAAVYYHFKAKDDLLVAVVGPLLDQIDALIQSSGPRLGRPSQRRDFLARYVDAVAGQAGVVALLLRDPGVGEHRLGQRFVAQHIRMRELLGAGDEPLTVIRATTALRALEMAVVEFGDVHPDDIRGTALDIALGVLQSEPGAGAPH